MHKTIKNLVIVTIIGNDTISTTYVHHCKNQIVKITALLVSTVTRNSI